MKKKLKIFVSKFGILLWGIFLLISTTGCESKEDREYRELNNRVKETEKAAEKARKEASDIQKTIDDYNYYSGRVKNAK